MSSVTIKLFSNPIDAHIAKDVLRREKIECFLADENISRIYPIPAFGVRLIVDEEDAANAKKILQENGLLAKRDRQPKKKASPDKPSKATKKPPLGGFCK